MSKCALCGRELLTCDVCWEQGLCNECYNKTKNSDPYFDVVVDKRKIQIREKYIEDLEQQLTEKDKEIATLKNALYLACNYITRIVDKDVNKLSHEWARYFIEQAKESLK